MEIPTIHPEMDDSFNEQMDFDRDWFDQNPKYAAMLRRPFEIESSEFSMMTGEDLKLVLVCELGPGVRQKLAWAAGDYYYFTTPQLDNSETKFALTDDVYQLLEKPMPFLWSQLNPDIQGQIRKYRKAFKIKRRDRKPKKGFG